VKQEAEKESVWSGVRESRERERESKERVEGRVGRAEEDLQDLRGSPMTIS